jgi:hypothetical protein
MSLHTTLPTFKVPFDPLTPLDPNEEPSLAAIHKLIAEVYANAGAVRTDLGGGQQGHLGLVMPEAEYLALPGTEPYAFPEQLPDIPRHTEDAAERDQWTKLYEHENSQYSDAQGLNLLLKAQHAHPNRLRRSLQALRRSRRRTNLGCNIHAVPPTEIPE